MAVYLWKAEQKVSLLSILFDLQNVGLHLFDQKEF